MKLYYHAMREHYGPDKCETMTVGQLIELLSQFDADTPIIATHDNGYTYGGIRKDLFEEVYDDEEEELYEKDVV